MRFISINGIVLDNQKVPIVKNGHSLKARQGTTQPEPPPPPPPPPPTASGSGDVVIKVKFNGIITSATSQITKAKYGKSAIVHLEEDDNAADFLPLVNYLQGGTAYDGNTYAGKTFTDGCGNTKKWTAALACNVKNNYTHDFIMQPDLAAGFGVISENDLPGLVAKDCFPIPHGYYHFDDDNAVHNPPSAPYWYKADGFTKSTNLSECVKYLWQKTGGFLARYMIIPQDSGGYNVPAKVQGLLGQSSEGVTDGEPEFPHAPELFANGNSYINDVIALNGAYAAYRRHFITDWNDVNQTNSAKSEYDYIVGNGTVDNPQFRRFGTHGYGTSGQWAAFKTFLDYLDANSGDKVWFTTLQEMLDYLEVYRLVVKTESIVGDTLTIKLNFNNIPNENLFRDLTLKVTGNLSIQSVTVSNAQGYSINTTTGLVNVFNRRKTVAYPYSQTMSGLVTGLLPLLPTDIWMDNSQQVRHDPLIDGNLTANYAPAGSKSSLIYSNYDIVINLERLRTTVSQVQISFGGGATPGDVATHVILVKTDDTEVDIGIFTQVGFNQTTSFSHAGTFRVAKLILRAAGDLGYGAEVRITGTYQPPLINPFKKERRPNGWMAGLNIHPWNLCTNTPHAIDENKMAILKSLDMDLGSLRCYDDAYAVQLSDGTWQIGTEIRGFPMDAAYGNLRNTKPSMFLWRDRQNQSLRAQEKWNVSDAANYATVTVNSYTDHGSWGELTATISSITGTLTGIAFFHIYSGGTKVDVADQVGGTVASGQVAFFNVGGGKGYTNGQSLQFRKSQKSHADVDYPSDNDFVSAKQGYDIYDFVGEGAFVYASRLGRNADVPDYPNVGGVENPMTKGGDLAHGTEEGNEWNAWWIGMPYGFWNGRDFCNAWSMVYDGHMGTYANRGAKQADPTMLVLTTGLASDKLDVLQGAIWQARKTRGLNPDGTINFPADVLNHHIYSSSGGQYSGGSGGLPPEQGVWRQVKEIVYLIENTLPQCQFFISEIGWDSHPDSPLNARTFGSYTDAKQVAAMWVIRTKIIAAKEGTDRIQWYRAYQDSNADDNNATQFATMEFLREITTTSFQRTIQGDYVKQYQELKDYVFDSEVETGIANVYCWKFLNPDGNYYYALWSEESTAIVGNEPVFTERTGTFAVPVPNNSPLAIRTFVDDGSGVMSTSNVTATGSTHNVAYGSKPKFIQIVLS